MKNYTFQVKQVQIKSQLLRVKHITLNVDNKVFQLSEAPDVKYRCSRLKFTDLEEGRVQLMTDGLKIIFSRDGDTAENISLFRSHVDQVCGTTSEQTHKKRPLSTAFVSTRSPTPERRHYAGNSPTMPSKYQRQIVSAVSSAKKALPKAPLTTSTLSSSAAAAHTPPRKSHHSLFGSPVPVNHRHGRSSSSSRGSNLVSSSNSDMHDSSARPTQNLIPARSPSQALDKKQNTYSSPHKVSIQVDNDLYIMFTSLHVSLSVS
jgi:hypothetical protein